MTSILHTTRRSLHKLLGGGVVILFGLKPSVSSAQGRPPYPEDFHAYLVIGEDGRVGVFSGKIEMGQGVLTSLAQMAAERLGVPADGLTVRDGVVSARADPSRRVSFGELSKSVRIAKAVDVTAVLRAAAQFEAMGRSAKRLDGLEKVTGQARYAADIRRPGMLHARVLRPPAHGATLVRADASAAETLAGVRVVRLGDLVAVLHADPEGAAEALTRVTADWRLPDPQPLDPDSIFDHILQHAGLPKEIAAKGDLARAEAVKSFETTFHKGYVAHAPMEPHAALAEVKDGRATIWASTQTPFPTRDIIAKALGLDPKAVRVITPFLGGGFGGKSASGQAVEAARLSQAVGQPVQVAWTRAEEFFYDTFDPASVVTISSGLDAEGRISRWDYLVYAASERGALTFYDIPNQRTRSAGAMAYEGGAAGAGLHPVSVGPWRGPGANMNVFAIESQIDMMAAAAGVDPLAFRLKHLSDPRIRRVLQAAADAFGWTPAVGPSGRGFGMACSVDAGSCVATLAEVKVDAASGAVRVLRIVCAQDMGIVVNPEGARMQIEGGLTMGLGYTLAEELRFHGGEVLDKNFSTYHLPRFSWVPQIQAVLVENNDLAPQGCGEPATTTTGAVIANAVFDATGVRMLRLPMTPERVRAALSAEHVV